MTGRSGGTSARAQGVAERVNVTSITSLIKVAEGVAELGRIVAGGRNTDMPGAGVDRACCVRMFAQQPISGVRILSTKLMERHAIVEVARNKKYFIAGLANVFVRAIIVLRAEKVGQIERSADMSKTERTSAFIQFLLSYFCERRNRERLGEMDLMFSALRKMKARLAIAEGMYEAWHAELRAKQDVLVQCHNLVKFN